MDLYDAYNKHHDNSAYMNTTCLREYINLIKGYQKSKEEYNRIF